MIGVAHRAGPSSWAWLPMTVRCSIEHLAEQMHGWRFTSATTTSRMLLAVHATFDVLDGLEGASLAERWARFEEPGLAAVAVGDGPAPDCGTRWGFGGVGRW